MTIAARADADGTAPGSLAGLLVIDLSRALAGPHAAMMLGDLGARVIKVEAEGTGDDSRGWGPPFVGTADDPQATYFLACNRNKESICLDLRSDDGRRTLERLVARADVLVENFRAGVMDRLGLSTGRLHALNPRLVVLSITGFGHDGPEGGRAGYDQIAQGEAGLMSMTGSAPDDPQRVGVPIADLLAGIYGAYGVLAGLHRREATGCGEVVRTSLLAALVGAHAFQGTRATVAGDTPRAQGNHHPSIAPYGLFACQDGSVQISVGNDKLWHRFCEAFGLDPAAPGFETNAERVGQRAETTRMVERAFAAYPAERLLILLDEAGIPAGRVRTLDEVYAWDQVASQGLLVEVEHTILGTITLPGPPLRFFESDGGGETETTRRQHEPPPALNQHEELIRAWLDRTEPGGQGSAIHPVRNESIDV
ncbi:CaiB/BaiF CoA transferase family protein [Leifsonia sp. NPDC058292]|uniref:CaiB/BaiF CoA transferase family protein n=1 Tax=Leifsonia sp. NPDC058292 TaxID=3346428 RepID=UPI0036D981D2